MQFIPPISSTETILPESIRSNLVLCRLHALKFVERCGGENLDFCLSTALFERASMKSVAATVVWSLSLGFATVLR